MSAAPITYLFVPGNRPERFSKALDSAADCIILDMEDAVAPVDKAQARLSIAQWMSGPAGTTGRVLVRINDDSTRWQDDDLAALWHLPWAGVMIPKCESPAQIEEVCKRLLPDVAVLPLIETARGLAAAPSIAAAPRVLRLAFGSLDYMVDLGLPRLRDAQGASSIALDIAAHLIAVASRCAGLEAPVAGVTPELDAAQVIRDMQHANNLGFSAKMCIHPMQLAAVRAALAPSDAELQWAQRVLSAWNASKGGALQVDGRMVDRPVVLRAQRILALASPSGGASAG